MRSRGVKLFVCPIPIKCGVVQVAKLFQRFGEVWDIKLGEMSPFHRSASLQMEEESARCAIRGLHLKRLLDPLMPLTVEYAPHDRVEPISQRSKSPVMPSISSDRQTAASVSDDPRPSRRAGAWIEMFVGGGPYFFNEDLRVAQWAAPPEFLEKYPTSTNTVDEYFDRLRPERSRKRARSPISTTTSISRNSSPLAPLAFRPPFPPQSSPPARPVLKTQAESQFPHIPSVRPKFHHIPTSRPTSRPVSQELTTTRPQFHPRRIFTNPSSNPCRIDSENRREQCGLLSPPPLIDPKSPGDLRSPPPLSPRAELSSPPPIDSSVTTNIWSPPSSPIVASCDLLRL